MKALTCPNCGTTIEVASTATRQEVFCKKCLENLNKSFIMLESSDDIIHNKGDGFFTKEG